MTSNYEYIGAPIKVTVPEYKESAVEAATVFFIVEVSTKENKWTLEKRFSEFDNLVKALKVSYHNIPALPGKSFLSKMVKMSDKQLDQRRKGLEQFLQQLVCRNDLMNSEQVKQFLQLDKNAAEAIVVPPRLLEEINIQGLSKGVRDFVYNRDDNMFYLVTGDMNPASRINAYVTNTKMPWEKDAPAGSKPLLEVGSVQAWSKNGSDFRKQWSKSYPSQAIAIEVWDGRAVIGLDDGIVDVLKISSSGFEDVACNKIHQSRVMGLHYDQLNSIVYSISEDKVLRISEGSTLIPILQNVHKDPLLALIGDRQNKRLFVGTKAGEILIYDISSKHAAKLLNTLNTAKSGAIRSFKLDLNRNYLFCGGFDDGELSVFDLDKPGKEKLAKQVATYRGKERVRDIVWAAKRSELISGTADGSITFWDAIKGKSIFVLQSAPQEITKMVYFEDTQTLVVACKSRTIKFWNLPERWMDPILMARWEKEANQLREKIGREKVSENARKGQEDSDEDDLAGWHLD